MSSESAAITIRSLDKSFLIYEKPLHRLRHLFFKKNRKGIQEFKALSDVSFEVARGETVGIIGKNGCGKSTLLQIVSGTLTPDAGEISVNGRVAALLELGAGFNPEFTGLENVALCAQLYGLDSDLLAQRLPDIVSFADIGDHLSQPVKTYSSGMFMRLAFSVVAHVDADILVIDEALAVGDAFFVQRCMRFLQDFKTNGGTILFVSHDMNAVRTLCDRAVWLEEGRVRAVADPSDISEEYLAALYNAKTFRGVAASPGDGDAVPEKAAEEMLHDARSDVINASNLRNDLQVFTLPGTKTGFGDHSARVAGVRIVDECGRALKWVLGGESVTLSIEVAAERAIASLVVGFFVKDKRGQPLFGDNTCLTYLGRPQPLAPGEACEVVFKFQMPTMPAGDYAISVAVADGNQDAHEICVWLHEAMIITSHSSYVPSGLLGIPMRHIEIIGSAPT